MPAEIGQPAPDFTLKNPANEEVTLSSFRGDKAVLVVFYPFTFSGICKGELCALRDDFSTFEDAGVQVLAVSCNTRHVQGRWAEDMGYQFPVLSDFWPHGAAALAFGVFNEKLGCAYRYTFLVNVDGTIVDAFGSDDIGLARERSRYDEALAKL